MVQPYCSGTMQADRMSQKLVPAHTQMLAGKLIVCHHVAASLPIDCRTFRPQKPSVLNAADEGLHGQNVLQSDVN